MRTDRSAALIDVDPGRRSFPDNQAPTRIQLTPRDIEALSFAAEHRFVLADHVAGLLDVTPASAGARLAGLAAAGFVTRKKVFHQQPPLHRITRVGLAVIGSRLPRLDLRCYEHDVGLAWLWLAARDRRFGPIREVIGERQLRSADASREAGEQPLAVRLGGFGAAGHERLHYPDLLLISPEGKRIAIELELTGKGRRRQEGIIGGYASDERIDAVVYLVKDGRLGRAIADAARRLGISSRVLVKPVSLTTGTPPGSPAASRGAVHAGVSRNSVGASRNSVGASKSVEASRNSAGASRHSASAADLGEG